MEANPSLMDPSLEKQLKGHRRGITALCYSPSEHQIASSSLDNSILLWDVDFRHQMRSYRFQAHDEAVMDVSFSPSGKYMASASRDRTVRIWVPTVTGSTGVFKAHSQTVRSVQFSPDGTRLITGSDDKIVKLWSSDNYKFISSFVGHTNWVRCARISNDGSLIASCSDDKTTRLWDPQSGGFIHSYQDQKGHGYYLAWHPSGCYIAVGTTQGNVKLYDIRTHNLVQYYSIHSDAVTQLAFHPSGSYILTASKDGKMKILDLLEGHPIFTLSGHNGAVNAVTFAPSGDAFASAGEDKVVFIWKTNFTELAVESKENVAQNPSSVPIAKSSSQTSKVSTAKGRNQGVTAWHLCYHSTKYPVTTFVHVDDIPEESVCESNCGDNPSPNSNMREPSQCSVRASVVRHTDTTPNNCSHGSSRCDSKGCQSHAVSDCPESRNCASPSDSPRACVSTKTQCKSPHFESNGCKSQCSSAATPRPCDVTHMTPRTCLDLTPCTPPAQTHCSSTSTPKGNQSHCSSNSVSRNSSNFAPHSGNKKNITQCLHVPDIETTPCETPRECLEYCSSYDVGHASHIPRVPPSPSTYEIPCVVPTNIATGHTTGTCKDIYCGDIFGMVKLGENDVCYTSGTIEWVGRKRSYPINSGFKIVKEFDQTCSNVKKPKTLDETFRCDVDEAKDCDCADVLPTMHAIVDHLNALHEAVDIVDLRLNTLENAMTKNN